jgi:hypothetical protein
MQEPMEDVVVDTVVIDGDVNSVGTEQIGSVKRIEPAELNWKRKLSKGISSPTAGECVTCMPQIQTRSIRREPTGCNLLGSKPHKPWIQHHL